MSEPLEIHVSRDGLHELEAPATFAAERSFQLRVRNHGRPVHVHLRPDETLTRATSVESGNHYLEGDDTLEMPVSVEADLDPDDRLSGTLRVVVGYGAAETDTEIALRSPRASSVTVDERLAEPAPDESRSGLLDRPTVPVLALGGLAVSVAVLAAVTVRTPAVVAGSLVVVAGVTVAAAFLWWDKRD